MANKEDTTQQQMLSNRHLKEWNDTTISEAASLYQLRCKHRIERDQLTFEKIADTEQHIILTTRQSKELNELRQENSEKRTAIRERHLKEENIFREKLAYIAKYYSVAASI